MFFRFTVSENEKIWSRFHSTWEWPQTRRPADVHQTRHPSTCRWTMQWRCFKDLFDLNGNGTLGFDELRESFASKKMPRVRQSCHMHCLHFFCRKPQCRFTSLCRFVYHFLSTLILGPFAMMEIDVSEYWLPGNWPVLPGCFLLSVSQQRMSRDYLESLTPIPMAALACYIVYLWVLMNLIFADALAHATQETLTLKSSSGGCMPSRSMPRLVQNFIVLVFQLIALHTCEEKMLGSTAVAKQLLREIADKLVSDRIQPEALFARPGKD